MIKQIIGAALGSKIAKQTPAIGGATGAALGTAVPFILSRLSIPALVVVGTGGYFAKKFYDKKQAEKTAEEIAGTKDAARAEAPESDTGTVIDPPPGGTTNGSGKAKAKKGSAHAAA